MNLYLFSSHYIDINFNTVKITLSFYTYSRTFGISNCSDLNVFNNIFNNLNTGVAYYFYHSTSGIYSDYNNLYSNGTNIGEFANTGSGQYVTNLSVFQTATGGDANSYNVNVNFVSDTDLHIVSTSEPLLGTAISGITTGIDGDTRNNPPFLGADESDLSGFYLNLSLFWEGPYNSLGNNMFSNLSVPTTSPFPEDPASVSSVPSNVVDWVFVQFRPSGNETNVIASKSAFLLEDGSIVDIQSSGSLYSNVAPIQYKVSVKHRNHLEVMSSTSVP